MEKITTFQKTFIDEKGRERIFNGINIPDKGGKDIDMTRYCHNVDDKFLDKAVELGFNLIRLGFTWALVEPEKGCYNEPYLDSIGEILDRCAKRNIYVFLDVHQDLYSSFDNYTGDGAPYWATLTDGYKPYAPKVVWGEGYFFSRAVHRAFDNFWTNKDIDGMGVQDYFVRMWMHVAERFKDHPAVFGYDFLNEPFPGKDGGKVFFKLITRLVRVTLFDSAVSKTRLIGDALIKDRRKYFLDQYTGDVLRKVTKVADKLINKFDTERYSPFVNNVAGAIRDITDEGIMIMENCYYSNLGIPCSTPAINYGGEREKEQCFAPHAYDFMVDTPAYQYASNDRVGSIFAEHKRTQDRLEVPVIVGEWGGGGSGDRWFPHIEFLLDTFDRNKWSQTYWACTGYEFLEQDLMRVLSRPYPVAVSGKISRYMLDRDENIFTLIYEQDREFSDPTVIYVPSEPKSIETDCKYETETINGGKSAFVRLYSSIGVNKVKISL